MTSATGIGARGGHVVDECPAAGEKRLVFAPLHGRPDVGGPLFDRAHHARPIAFAAPCTAMTMLW